jgi:hypothetical protein
VDGGCCWLRRWLRDMVAADPIVHRIVIVVVVVIVVVAETVVGIGNSQLIERMMRLLEIFLVGKSECATLEIGLVGDRRPRCLIVLVAGDRSSDLKHVSVRKGVSKPRQETSTLGRVGKIGEPPRPIKGKPGVLVMKGLNSTWDVVMEFDRSIALLIITAIIIIISSSSFKSWTGSVGIEFDLQGSGGTVSVAGGFHGECRVRHLRFSAGHHVMNVLQRTLLRHDSEPTVRNQPLQKSHFRNNTDCIILR